MDTSALRMNARDNISNGTPRPAGDHADTHQTFLGRSQDKGGAIADWHKYCFIYMVFVFTTRISRCPPLQS